MKIKLNMREWIRSYGELDEIKFVIYPFGENGKRTQKILNNEFHIDEYGIVDDYAEGEKITRSAELEKYNEKNVVFLLNAVNCRLNEQLQKKIRTACPLAKTANILEPAVVEKQFKADYFVTVKKLLKTRAVSGHSGNFIRVGKDNDGGYIMFDHFPADVKAYSFGIARDVSWDKAFVELTDGEVYMYDHTIDELPEENKRFHWEKIGIGGDSSADGHLMSMSDILRKNGHFDHRNLILKMDVEGAEWEVIQKTPSDIFNHFDQMAFEFHGMTKLEQSEKVIKSLEKLNLSHQCVWIHGNNYGLAERALDVLLPTSLEVLYMNRENYIFNGGGGTTSFPISLDMPCNPYLKDFELGDW